MGGPVIAIYILGASIVLQFVAAGLAVRLIRITNRRTAWSLIAAALALMSIRRCITFYNVLFAEVVIGPDIQAELVALVISGLMVVGIARIGDLFRNVQQAHDSLRASEERFRQVAENIREVFWITDAEKKQMIYVSPAYEEIWGRSRESLYRRPRSFLEAVYADDRERVTKSVKEQARGEYDEVYRIVRPDGTLR